MNRIISSQAICDIAPEELVTLLEGSRRNNQAGGLGGTLHYSSQGFLQVLQGNPEALAATCARVGVDERHDNLRLLSDAEVVAPLFLDWTGGFEHVDDGDLGEDLDGLHSSPRVPAVKPRPDWQRWRRGDPGEAGSEGSIPGSLRRCANARDGMRVPQGTEVELVSLGRNDGCPYEVNRAFAALPGRRSDEVNIRPLLEVVPPDDQAKIVAGIAPLERGEFEVKMENRLLHADGGPVHLLWVDRPVPGTDAWWAAGRNTTEFHVLFARRPDPWTSLDVALGQTLAALWDLDVKTGVFTWEPRAAELPGVAADSLANTRGDLAATVNSEDSVGFLKAVQGVGHVGAAESGMRIGQDAGFRHLSLRGQVLTRDRRGRPLRAVGLHLVMTEAEKEQMLSMVLRDALTGVPNRGAFDQALRTKCRRCACSGAILRIDIDKYKRFNDTVGHPIGDPRESPSVGQCAAACTGRATYSPATGGRSSPLSCPVPMPLARQGADPDGRDCAGGARAPGRRPERQWLLQRRYVVSWRGKVEFQ